MGLGERIIMSETVGFLHGIVFRALNRLQYGKKDRETIDRQIKANEDDDREVADVVRVFLDAHPSLAPERFGVDLHRLHLSALFVGVDVVRMMLRRGSRTIKDGFILASNGAVYTMARSPGPPAHATQREISEWMKTLYKIRPEERTLNLGKVLQNEHERRGEGLVHAQAILRWMQAALREKPDLMRGFVAMPCEEFLGSVILKETKTSLGDDPLMGWRLKN